MKKVAALALSATLMLTSLGQTKVSVNAQSSESLSRFSMEGYATVQNVTGGGVLEESDANYYKAATAVS